ncbi:MAG: T9SS type A sorting domain-containing protein [Lewinellaceae bacterium]|nr:T9SS type A sorting domain-containing protein [Phaeodactylibacter sp.]MCB9350743.1 T9SS type A sorting domain-containing protein [Lewinellaceae bacterium]
MALRTILLCSFFLITTFLAAQQTRVVGYLPYQRFYLLEDIPLEKLTHLCIAFANPDEKGYLSAGGADLRAVVRRAHQDSVKVLISLAGGAMKPEWKEAWPRLISPWNRTAFIQKILLFVEVNELDGVDVDLEWKLVNQHYSGFVLELREALSARGKLMTAALPGTTRYKHLTEKAMLSFDFINLMAYDLTGPWTAGRPGPHSPYTMAISSLHYWKNQGMPADKLVLGIPLYGWDFSEAGTATSVPYGTIVASNPAYAHVDQVGKLYYNGIVTATAKTELAKEQAGGVMLWELGKDAYNEYSILATVYQTLYASGAMTPDEMLADVNKPAPPIVDDSRPVTPAVSGLPFSDGLHQLASAGFQQEPLMNAPGAEIFSLEIDVLPNPFQDSLKITNKEKGPLQLVLTDIKGRSLYETTLRPNASISWETTSFPPGHYIFSAMRGDKQASKRLIKM